MASNTISLRQVLSLVGPLDDAPGNDTPRERLRRHLQDSVRDVGTVRDYIEECLRTAGTNYNRALQDLVNHLGTFLGFEVTYGRYQGVSGQVGHDGLWRSPSGLHVVVEIKTTDAYAIRTSTLMGYIGALISEQEIPTKRDALGLYVVGRADAELRQVENAIAAEGRSEDLRIITVASLLDLADLMQQYDVSHEDVLTIIRPSGPRVDAVVELLSRLAARSVDATPPDVHPGSEPPTPIPAAPDLERQASYWISPVKDMDSESALECVQRLVGRHQIYALSSGSHARTSIQVGDWICFYASGTGVVAHAQVASAPEQEPRPEIRDPEGYPWTFPLAKVSLYVDRPVVFDAVLRARLEAFQGRDPTAPWSWIVLGTRQLNRHDFMVVTGQAE